MEAARPATADDLEQVAELAVTAVDELASHKGGSVWVRREARPAPVIESLTRALSADERHVAVGTIGGTVVGYGVARVEVLRDGGQLGVVEDLYVDEGCRGVGVGEAVMNELVEWCRSQGCFGVDSLVLPGDRAAKNFFESFGLVARAIVVHRSLSS